MLTINPWGENGKGKQYLPSDLLSASGLGTGTLDCSMNKTPSDILRPVVEKKKYKKYKICFFVVRNMNILLGSS